MCGVLSACRITSYIPAVTEGRFQIINCYRLFETSATSVLMENAFQIGRRYCMQMLAQNFLFNFKNQISNQRNKTSGLVLPKAALKMLKRNVTTVGSSDIICSQILYLFGSHGKSLQMALKARHKLQQHTVACPWVLDISFYTQRNGHNMPHIEFITKHLANICINTGPYETCFDLVNLEVSVAHANCCPVYFPPLVMTIFLIVLNYHALKDTIRRDDALRELEAILMYDDGRQIDFNHRAISWEILGICHQMCRNFYSAYQCYLVALNDEYNDFKQATMLRILSLWY